MENLYLTLNFQTDNQAVHQWQLLKWKDITQFKLHYVNLQLNIIIFVTVTFVGQIFGKKWLDKNSVEQLIVGIPSTHCWLSSDVCRSTLAISDDFRSCWVDDLQKIWRISTVRFSNTFWPFVNKNNLKLPCRSVEIDTLPTIISPKF